MDRAGKRVSDNLLTATPAELMRHSVSGEAASSSDQWNRAYDYIRKVNYLLQNEHKADPDDLFAQHYIHNTIGR